MLFVTIFGYMDGCPDVMFLKETRIKPPFPEGTQLAYFGLGCFWGGEEAYNLHPDIYSVCCGYSGGDVVNPTYKQVKTGTTGHTEVVQVVFDPSRVSYWDLLKIFWEKHDPTQGDRQGIDVGSQYRSAIYYTTEAQRDEALRSKEIYQQVLREAGKGEITTEIKAFETFYWAEEYHQQYFMKGCAGECGVSGSGIPFPS